MIKAVLFDIYGTLIDIQTDESSMNAYEIISRYLEYKHIYMSPDQVKWFYHAEFARRIGQEPPRPSSIDDFRKLLTHPKQYQDDDIRNVFNTILEKYGFPEGSNRNDLSTDLSHLFRSLTRKNMFVYPTVKPGLELLQKKYRLGIISNAQEAFTLQELDVYGLRKYFDIIVLSSQAGIKKPNPGIFKIALDKMAVSPEETVFVGNDPFADILGASIYGMKTVLIGQLSGSIAGIKPDATISAANLTEVLKIIESWR
ncbi:MAG TPA: HAD family hydrolase [Methanocella sp.]|nr:HAD family hydrolase [Methanocella sp.]